MTFSEYQHKSRRTRNTAIQTEREQYSSAALGLAGEAGEACDHIKKVLHHGHDLDRAKLKSELGDVLFYLAWLADLCGTTLEGVAEGNVSKLAKRYPDGFDPERSRNRSEHDAV